MRAYVRACEHACVHACRGHVMPRQVGEVDAFLHSRLVGVGSKIRVRVDAFLHSTHVCLGCMVRVWVAL